MANRLCSITVATLILVPVGVAQRTAPAERQPRPQQDTTILQDKQTQTIGVPRDPPLVAIGETSKLVFHVSPLSGEGLLSQQTRQALKTIQKLNDGAPIIHIRAFSAGNGDIRRIPQIVSDALGDKHGPLPSVSVLQVGRLTLNGAQVVLETVSQGKKDTNKDGLTFHPAEDVLAIDPATSEVTLLQTSVDRLAAKMDGKPALSVTCFVSTLDDPAEFARIVANRFPGATTNIVQPRRLAWQTAASCEGVSRGGGLASQRLAFSGTQVAFGAEEKDALLAVQHLDRTLGEANAPRSAATFLRLYLLAPGTRAVALKEIGVSTQVVSLPVEGVGAVSAGFAIDAINPIQ
jgi:hypothetical protein